MIFHASIEADNPAATAAALARLWRGEAFPFPPVAEGSHIVMAGDPRNSAIEVYPRGAQLHYAAGEPEVRTAASPSRHGAVHLAIASPLSPDEVFAVAADAGWTAQRCLRGGMFEVLEVWIDGGFLVEVLTPQMQAQYLATMTPDGWRAALAQGPALADA